jgi:hypothetical protein
MLSIRPESLSPTAPNTPNSLRARVVETTYLGDLAQHSIELAGGVSAKVATLNPSAVRTTFEAVRIGPEDITLLLS